MAPRRWFSPDARALCAVMGQSDPAEAMVRRAQDLLDEVSLTRPPFDPRILASWQRAIVEVRDMRGDARLVPRAEGLLIEVNSGHSRGKQNFSIDHEVAHTLLPSYRGQLVDDAETGTFPASSEVELLCDIGAATLLLDPRRVQPLAAAAGPSLWTLIDLAERFQASLEATARCLTNLDLWPCAVVFWEDGYRLAERPGEGAVLLPGLESFGLPAPRLRVTRAYCSCRARAAAAAAARRRRSAVAGHPRASGQA